MFNNFELFFFTSTCEMNLFYTIITLCLGMSIMMYSHYKFEGKIVPVYLSQLIGIIASIPFTLMLFSLKHYLVGECI